MSPRHHHKSMNGEENFKKKKKKGHYLVPKKKQKRGKRRKRRRTRTRGCCCWGVLQEASKHTYAHVYYTALHRWTGLRLSLVCCTHAHPDHSGGAMRYANNFPQRCSEMEFSQTGEGDTENKKGGQRFTKDEVAKKHRYQRGVPILIHPKACAWYGGGIGGFFQWALDVALAVLVSLTANPRGPLFNPCFTVPSSTITLSSLQEEENNDTDTDPLLFKHKEKGGDDEAPMAMRTININFSELADAAAATTVVAVKVNEEKRRDDESSNVNTRSISTRHSPPAAAAAAKPFSLSDKNTNDNVNDDHVGSLSSSSSSSLWQIIQVNGHTDHMFMLYFPKGKLLYVSDMIILNSGHLKTLRRWPRARFPYCSSSSSSTDLPRSRGSAPLPPPAAASSANDASSAASSIPAKDSLCSSSSDLNGGGDQMKMKTKKRGRRVGGGFVRDLFYFIARHGNKPQQTKDQQQQHLGTEEEREDTCIGKSQLPSWWAPFFSQNPFKVSAPVPIDLPQQYHSSLDALKDLDVATLAFPHGEVVPVELLASSSATANTPPPPSPSPFNNPRQKEISAGSCGRRRAWLEVLFECDDKARVPMFARTWLCGYNSVLPKKQKCENVQNGLVGEEGTK